MTMQLKTIEILKEAGWYEGRRIDITEQIKVLQERGFIVFDDAKKFLEEFGELTIIDRTEEDDGVFENIHETVLEEVISDYNSGVFKLKYVEEKTLPIGYIHNGEMYLWISESGKFYIDRGFIAESVEEMWNHIIGDGGRIICWKNM